MGKFDSSGLEQAQTVVTGSLAALNAVSNSGPFLVALNFSVSGTFVGTIALQRSFDGGSTFIPVYSGTTAIQFTAPASTTVYEIEPGVIYRAQATAYTSGTAVVRLSAGANDAPVARLS